jgi:hypothetical protein
MSAGGLGSWWRDTPEAQRLLAIERHRLDVAEATYGLDKRQSRRVRRRMGRPIAPEPAEPSREQRIEAAEDRAEQAAFDAARERS